LKLNLGCGRDIRPEPWINVDQFNGEGVDIVMNLDSPEGIQFDLLDNSVEEIYASHVLEHLVYWHKILPELYRVLVPGGRLEIRVPYGCCPLTFHVRTFYKETMDNFISNPTLKSQYDLELRGVEFNVTQRSKRLLPFLKNGHNYAELNHRWRFAWHLEHYMGLKTSRYHKHGIPFLLIPWEIVWKLEKPQCGAYECHENMVPGIIQPLEVG